MGTFLACWKWGQASLPVIAGRGHGALPEPVPRPSRPSAEKSGACSRFRCSIPGMADARGDIFPGSVAASLAGAAWAWLVALLLGAALFRLLRRGEGLSPAARLTAWACAGMAAQGLVDLGLSSLGILRPAVVAGAALAMLAAGLAGGGPRVRR